MNSVSSYCEWLGLREQNKGTNALGFIPRPRLEQYESQGRILVVRENDELAGMLVHGTGRGGVMRIYQACVQYDARRREKGLSLVANLEAKAIRMGCGKVRLRCASDLESNAFWAAAGYFLTGVEMGGRRRGRLINVYEKPLPIPRLFDLATQ